METIYNLIDQKEEQINREIEGCIKEAKQIAKTEMNLFRFELLFSSVVPKRKLDSITKSIRKERDKVWKECLKRTNGDSERAMEIYDEVAEEIA